MRVENMGTIHNVPIIDHAIIYNMNPSPEKINKDREIFKSCWKKCDEFMWNWKPKHNAIDYVTRQDIQYVCGYVQKKLHGDYADAEYTLLGRESPFQLVSQGIGKRFALEHSEEIKNRGYMYYNGHKVRVPRYFRELLGFEKVPADMDFEAYQNALNYRSLPSQELKMKYIKQAEENTVTSFMAFNAWLKRHGYPADYFRKLQLVNTERAESLYYQFCDELQNDYCSLIFKQSNMTARRQNGIII